MWSESDGRVHVAVTDNKTGEAFTVEVREGESAAKVFQHPFAMPIVALPRRPTASRPSHNTGPADWATVPAG